MMLFKTYYLNHLVRFYVFSFRFIKNDDSRGVTLIGSIINTTLYNDSMSNCFISLKNLQFISAHVLLKVGFFLLNSEVLTQIEQQICFRTNVVKDLTYVV